MGDLGFAEAYMFGDVLCEDLISTFLVSIDYPLALPVNRSNPRAGVSKKQGKSRFDQLDTLMALFPPSAAHILLLSQLTRERPFEHLGLSDGTFKGMNPRLDLRYLWPSQLFRYS